MVRIFRLHIYLLDQLGLQEPRLEEPSGALATRRFETSLTVRSDNAGKPQMKPKKSIKDLAKQFGRRIVGSKANDAPTASTSTGPAGQSNQGPTSQGLSTQGETAQPSWQQGSLQAGQSNTRIRPVQVESSSSGRLPADFNKPLPPTPGAPVRPAAGPSRPPAWPEGPVVCRPSYHCWVRDH